MSIERQIQSAIRKLAGTQLADEVYLIPCEVEAVDLDKMTCDCIAVGGTAVTDIPNVQLLAEVNDGFVLVPAVGSAVMVLYSKRQNPVIIMYSELQSVLLDVGNSSLDVTNDLIKFNSGNFGGLVKVADLVSKLNNLENLVNDLIAKYNAHTHISAGSGSPTAPPVPLENNTLTPTVRGDIENTTVTHG